MTERYPAAREIRALEVHFGKDDVFYVCAIEVWVDVEGDFG